MARYKDYNLDQSKFIPIVFSDQITPGTFEYTVNILVDEHIDMSRFDERYINDENGRPAYDPSLLLKVVLAAYARGVSSSRKIERLCRENVVFMALSADMQPHFTTIANFISQMGDVIEPIFTEVLMVCDNQGLIGRDMFAIDGCKLPSNASKEWSGTIDELQNKQKKITRAVRRMLKKHREEDASPRENDHTRRDAEKKNIETLRKASRKIKAFCATAEKKLGTKGNELKSNITDNESAKMKTSHGTIQGYNGVAAVDNKHQIIVGAEAFGQGPENDLLEPMIETVENNLGEEYIAATKLTADSGFHNKSTLSYCQEKGLDAYIADGGFRKRDPRFADRDRFQPAERKAEYFKADEFEYDKESGECICPAGKTMWVKNKRIMNGLEYIIFAGYLKDCRECPLKNRCMKNKPDKIGRQVAKKIEASKNRKLTLIDKMKTKIDSETGRHIYSQRLGTVEPVFGNINTNKGLNRFTLRGKPRVNAQWLMYCLVHNIEKIQHYGQAA